MLISFVSTNSHDIVPVATAPVTQLEDRLDDEVGRDIFFISLTLDPERDTPALLKDYADAFGAGHGWLFLTGRPTSGSSTPSSAARACCRTRSSSATM